MGPSDIAAENLFRRQEETMLASWRAYASYSAGALVIEARGATLAVFPSSPEREVYNNAVLPRTPRPDGLDALLGAIEGAYAEAGVERFALWAHEPDPGLDAALRDRGYGFDTSTRAMAMALGGLPERPPKLELGSLSWAEYGPLIGLPGLLPGAGAEEFHLRVAVLDGRPVSSAFAFDHDGDCGIFNLGTDEAARRRGLGSALTALQLHEARDRGCETASLQATAMAAGLYAALGFVDLGGYFEYVRT